MNINETKPYKVFFWDYTHCMSFCIVLNDGKYYFGTYFDFIKIKNYNKKQKFMVFVHLISVNLRILMN